MARNQVLLRHSLGNNGEHVKCINRVIKTNFSSAEVKSARTTYLCPKYFLCKECLKPGKDFMFILYDSTHRYNSDLLYKSHVDL